MAEQKENALTKPAGIPTALPVVYVSRFALGMSSNDLHLTVGMNRSVLPSDPQGLPEIAATEWYNTLVMSPQSAKQLMLLLERTVGEFEKAFGVVKTEGLTVKTP